MHSQTTKYGHELEVGDMIEMWTPRSVYRITALRTYYGPLASWLSSGEYPARTAAIVGGPLHEVTIEPFSRWTVVS